MSNFKTDDDNMVFHLLVVVEDFEVKMVVQGIAQDVAATVLNQNTTNRIAMFVECCTIGSLDGDHTGKIVN